MAERESGRTRTWASTAEPEAWQPLAEDDEWPTTEDAGHRQPAAGVESLAPAAKSEPESEDRPAAAEAETWNSTAQAQEWPPVPTTFSPPWSVQPPPAPWAGPPSPPITEILKVVVAPRPLRLAKPASRVPAEPTRAALVEHATAEEMRVLAPEPAAETVEEAADSHDHEPSRLAAAFWTVVAVVVVVGLVLAFLVFLTGMFR